MEDHVIAASGIGDGDHEGLAIVDDCDVSDEASIENLMQGSRVMYCISRNAPYPCAWRRPG